MESFQNNVKLHKNETVPLRKKKDRGSIAVCILQSRKVFFFFRENDDDRLCQSKHFAQGRPKHLHTENETRNIF